MIRFPEVYHEVECAGIGYPGIRVRVLVNPVGEPAAQIADGHAGGPWDSLFYRQMAQMLRTVTVAAEMTEDGQGETVEIRTPYDVWRLEHRSDFDPLVLAWVRKEFLLHRLDWLEAAAKN